MIRALIIAVLLFAAPAWAREGVKAQPGQFDYLLLDLTWSPQFCAQGKPGSEKECRLGRGFTVHGLWPQFEDGTWPQYCSREKLPARVAKSVEDLMPDEGLARHEWNKHGTCTGLDSARYFAELREIMGRITVPEAYRDPKQTSRVGRNQLIADFVAANRALGLEREHMALRCEGERLAGLAICLSKDGKSTRACGKINYRCRANEVLLAP